MLSPFIRNRFLYWFFVVFMLLIFFIADNFFKINEFNNFYLTNINLMFLSWEIVLFFVILLIAFFILIKTNKFKKIFLHKKFFYFNCINIFYEFSLVNENLNYYDDENDDEDYENDDEDEEDYDDDEDYENDDEDEEDYDDDEDYENDDEDEEDYDDGDEINPYDDEIKKWNKSELIEYCENKNIIDNPKRFRFYSKSEIIEYIKSWYSGYNVELGMDLNLRYLNIHQLRKYCDLINAYYDNKMSELDIACEIAGISRKDSNALFGLLYFLTSEELKKLCKRNNFFNYKNLNHRELIDVILDNDLDPRILKAEDFELPWFGIDKDKNDNDNQEYENYDENKNSSQKENNSTNFDNFKKISNITLKDIAGLESAKKAFEEKVILPIKYAELYKNFKKKTGGGILLFGLPGTGKTMFAEAVANEIEAKYFSIKCSDIKSKWFGESESRIKKFFENARKSKRAIIFMDEFESIGRKRTGESDSSIVHEILAQMQGVGTDNSNVLVIAATNRPWDIDSALLRPGRFDEKIYVPLPDFLARKEIFKIKLKDIPVENLDFDYLAKITENFNGADINYFCEQLKMSAIKRSIKEQKEQKISKVDLDIVKLKMKSSVNLNDQKEMEKFLNQYYV